MSAMIRDDEDLDKERCPHTCRQERELHKTVKLSGDVIGCSEFSASLSQVQEPSACTREVVGVMSMNSSLNCSLRWSCGNDLYDCTTGTSVVQDMVHHIARRALGSEERSCPSVVPEYRVVRKVGFSLVFHCVVRHFGTASRV